MVALGLELQQARDELRVMHSSLKQAKDDLEEQQDLNGCQIVFIDKQQTQIAQLQEQLAVATANGGSVALTAQHGVRVGQAFARSVSVAASRIGTVAW